MTYKCTPLSIWTIYGWVIGNSLGLISSLILLAHNHTASASLDCTSDKINHDSFKQQIYWIPITFFICSGILSALLLSLIHHYCCKQQTSISSTELTTALPPSPAAAHISIEALRAPFHLHDTASVGTNPATADTPKEDARRVAFTPPGVPTSPSGAPQAVDVWGEEIGAASPSHNITSLEATIATGHNYDHRRFNPALLFKPSSAQTNPSLASPIEPHNTNSLS